MSPEQLIRMANQIAQACKARGEDAAIAATAEHISNFWEPRMRARLFVLLDKDPTRFDDIVRRAGAAIRPVRNGLHD